MKKWLSFFLGGMLLVITFGTIIVAGGIYDAAQQKYIDTYFFQTNAYASQRPGTPTALANIREKDLLGMLINKYVYEYFYVLPYVDNITVRQSKGGVLDALSTSDVFQKWTKNVAPEIRKMAELGMMRTVSIIGIEKNSRFYTVNYKLTTWTQPNNMTAPPVTETGVLLLGLHFEPTIFAWYDEAQGNSVDKVLARGKNPATIFTFWVNYVEQVDK